MSSLTPKLLPKSASKLARPTGLAQTQARSSPTPPSNKTQVVHEKSHKGTGQGLFVAEGYAIKPSSNKQTPGAVSADGQPEPVPVDDFRIGDRVWVAGAKPGIIAFIGEVQFGTGEWAGVVLDSPVGKNDGSVNGVRYFMCEPKRGIFSRLTKLSRTPLPKSDSPALSDKSSVSEDATTTPKSQATVSPPSAKTAKPSEEKTSNGEGVSTPKSSGSGIPSALPRRLSTGSHSSQGQVSPSGGSVTDIPAMGHKYLFKVGDRVTVSGSKTGVIRYLGEADFAKGTWVGVELDEPLGKNDGSVAGKRYFTCSPMFGLFAPFHKVELFHGTSGRPNVELNISALRRGSLQKLGYGDGFSRERTGSQESISSIGSAASSTSRSGRMRLGITSLATQGAKVRTTAYGATPTVSALQKSLKEKEEHVEQLLRERDVERADFIRTAGQIEELESQLSAQKSEHTKLIRESEEAIRRLKISLERADLEKTEVYNQLLDERRKVEDLQFTVEEATIDKGDIETEVKKYSQKMKDLEAALKVEKERVHRLTKDPSGTKSEPGKSPGSIKLTDDTEEEYLDQIEELTHKLFIAENQIKALQQGDQTNSGESVPKAEAGKPTNEKKVANDQMTSLREEKQALQKQLKDMTADRDRLQSKTDELNQENASLKKLMQEIEGRTKDFKNQVETLKSEHETVVKEMQKKIQQEIRQSREQTTKKVTELEKENGQLKTTVNQLKETVKDKEAKLQQVEKEVAQLKSGGKILGSEKSTNVSNQETIVLQQRIQQLEKTLNESQTNANLVNNRSSSSADPAIAKLKSEKESADKQIDFLNSVIVEIQRKNVELETRLKAMDPSVSLTSSVVDGHSTNGTNTKTVAPRLFCDICDVFDLHDTDDCPKQDMSNSPPASHHHGNPKEERPYCTTCEVFGHTSDRCVEEQTF